MTDKISKWFATLVLLVLGGSMVVLAVLALWRVIFALWRAM